jgi:hypothetical protein
MLTSECLNFYKVKLLLLKNINEGLKEYLAGLGALFSFIFILFLFKGFFSKYLTQNYYDKIFFITLIISGAYFTSHIFKNIHKRYLCHDWLMTPASNLEKFIEKILVSIFLYPLVFSLLFFLLTIISYLSFPNTLNAKVQIFNLFRTDILMTVLNAVIINSCFLPGSLYFKKNNFIKSVFSISVLFIICIIVSVLTGKFIFQNYGLNIHFEHSDFIFFKDSLGLVFTFIKYFYYIGLAPLCWIITFKKLEKIQNN